MKCYSIIKDNKYSIRSKFTKNGKTQEVQIDDLRDLIKNLFEIISEIESRIINLENRKQ